MVFKYIFQRKSGIEPLIFRDNFRILKTFNFDNKC